MDALKIKTLEEDNVFLRGQVQLLQARNAQLEARITELTALISRATSEPPSTATQSLENSEDEAQYAAYPQTDENQSDATPTGVETPATSTSQTNGALKNSRGPSVDTRIPLASSTTSNTYYDPPTPRATPTDSKPGKQRASSALGRSSSALVGHSRQRTSPIPGHSRQMTSPIPSHARHPTAPTSGHSKVGSLTIGSAMANAAASMNRMRSQTIASTGPPPLPLPPQKLSNSHGPSSRPTHTPSGSTSRPRPGPSRPVATTISTPAIIYLILSHAVSLPRADDPFLQDPTTRLWNNSLKLLKTLALVSRVWHASIIPFLYSHIRIRRIPQLAVLVETLERSAILYASQPSSSSKAINLRPYGSYATHLDLSFYIPPEWNTLYATDILRLLRQCPNLTSYRSRPMLPTLAPRSVPTPILHALSDTRNDLLTELELGEQEGPQIPDLIRLLQNCSYLEKLSIGKYIFEGGLGKTAEVLRLPSLKTLELRVTGRPTPGSFSSHTSTHILVEASKWDLPVLEEINLILFDSIVLPFPSLGPFLNIHGHKLQRLTVKDVNPLMRNPPLSVNSILSRCPSLREVSIVGSCTAPLVLARPHLTLERVVFLGPAPGSKREPEGVGHLLALRMDNIEGREKLPALREVVLQPEADAKDSAHLRFSWEGAVGSEIVISWAHDVAREEYERLSTSVVGHLTVEDEDDSDDEDWLPENQEVDSDEEREDAYWETLDDDEEVGSDEETVRDSRSGRDDDSGQVDHQGALLVFHDSLHKRRGIGGGTNSSRWIGSVHTSRPPMHMHVSRPSLVGGVVSDAVENGNGLRAAISGHAPRPSLSSGVANGAGGMGNGAASGTESRRISVQPEPSTSVLGNGTSVEAKRASLQPNARGDATPKGW